MTKSEHSPQKHWSVLCGENRSVFFWHFWPESSNFINFHQFSFFKRAFLIQFLLINLFSSTLCHCSNYHSHHYFHIHVGLGEKRDKIALFFGKFLPKKTNVLSTSFKHDSSVCVHSFFGEMPWAMWKVQSWRVFFPFLIAKNSF